MPGPIRGVLTVLLATVALAAPMHYVPGIHLANESVRVYQALAIVDHGTLDLGPVFDTFVPGWRRAGAPPNMDVTEREGRYLVDKAPGTTLLAVPIVAGLRAAGVDLPFHRLTWLLALLLAAVPTALAAAAMARWLAATPRSSPSGGGRSGGRAVPARSAEAPAWAAALASPWAVYGGMFFGHALCAATLAGGALLALGPADRGANGSSRGRAILGGFLLGWAVLSEYPAAFPVALVCGALLLDRARRPALPWVILGGAGPAVALLAWNTVAFGSPLALSYAYKAAPELQAIHAQGLYGFGMPDAGRLWEILAGPARGLLFGAPWLALAFPGAWRAARDPDLATGWRVFLPAAVVGLPVFVSGFVDWPAGDALGPRHLVPAIPLMALAAGRAVRAGGRGGAWLAIAGLALVVPSWVLMDAAAWTSPHFPQAVRNPLFEIALPVLLEHGPTGAVVSGIPAIAAFLAGLAASAAVLGPPLARAFAAAARDTGRAALAAVVGLGLAVLHPGIAAGPETPGACGPYRVLDARALAVELSGRQGEADALRRRLADPAWRECR